MTQVLTLIMAVLIGVGGPVWFMAWLTTRPRRPDPRIGSIGLEHEKHYGDRRNACKSRCSACTRAAQWYP